MSYAQNLNKYISTIHLCIFILKYNTTDLLNNSKQETSNKF